LGRGAIEWRKTAGSTPIKAKGKRRKVKVIEGAATFAFYRLPFTYGRDILAPDFV